MSETYDVYVIYSRKDGRRTAAKLRKYLVCKGLRVCCSHDKEALTLAGAYVFISSPDFFRQLSASGGLHDEMIAALAEYEKDSENCPLLPVMTAGTVFPEQAQLPEDVCSITLSNRVISPRRRLTEAELARVYDRITTPTHRSLWYCSQRASESMKVPKKRSAAELPSDNLMLVSKNAGSVLSSVMYAAYDEKTYSPDVIVPIFVDLSDIPKKYDERYANGVSSAIVRKISLMLRGCEFDDDIAMLTELFSNDTATPQYLLLISGIDTLAGKPPKHSPNGFDSTIKEMLVDEVKTILEECNNVRVMIACKAPVEGLEIDSPLYSIRTTII